MLKSKSFELKIEIKCFIRTADATSHTSIAPTYLEIYFSCFLHMLFRCVLFEFTAHFFLPSSPPQINALCVYVCVCGIRFSLSNIQYSNDILGSDSIWVWVTHPFTYHTHTANARTHITSSSQSSESFNRITEGILLRGFFSPLRVNAKVRVANRERKKLLQKICIDFNWGRT